MIKTSISSIIANDERQIDLIIMKGIYEFAKLITKLRAY